MKDKIKLYNVVKELTKSGYRVMLVLKLTIVILVITFIGFVVIKDEIRSNAKEGLRMVESAGTDYYDYWWW